MIGFGYRAKNLVAQLVPQHGQLRGIKFDISQTKINSLVRPNHLPRQRQVFADMARAVAQEVTAAHVREQTDIGFGHRHFCVLRDDAYPCPQRNTQTAAHDHAIHERDIGLGVGLDQVVKGVFLGEEVFKCLKLIGIARQRCLVKKANVTTCTKPAEQALRRAGSSDLVGAAYRHQQHGRIVPESPQRRREVTHHLQAERVERLGPIQGYEPRTAAPLYDDVAHGIDSRRATSERVCNITFPLSCVRFLSGGVCAGELTWV